MNVDPVAPVDLQWLVSLINEFAPQPRAEAGESQDPYPDLSEHDQPMIAAEVANDARTQVAARLWAVFAAEDRVSGAAAMNELLADAKLSPRISAGGELEWMTSTRSPESRLAASCAAALLEAVRRYGWDRLGICDGRGCVDAFIDRQTRTTRRYCSPTCLNRARVRAHRARNST